MSERVCKMYECNERVYSRNMCKKHYLRWYRVSGEADRIRKASISKQLMYRFMNKVSVEEDRHWLWKDSLGGGTTPYFTFKGGDGKREQAPARRWLYEWFYGEVGKDEMVVRTCDEIRCVSPEHMEVKKIAWRKKKDMEEGKEYGGMNVVD